MEKQRLKPSIKSFISIRWHKFLPRLIIHEKYEKLVKWILRILTLIGIISSAFTLYWYFSLTVAIVLVLVEQFFERAIFQYTTIYVQPIPDFEYKSEEWKGMIFGYPEDGNKNFPKLIGLGFKTEEYAKKFFNLLKQWNYNDLLDKNNNICLSFIIENEKEYSTYLYPNLRRETIGKFFTFTKRSSRLEKYGKEQLELIFNIIFCKLFPFGLNSRLKLFMDRYEEGEPYILDAYIFDKNKIREIPEINPIEKYHLKYKKRIELTKDEIEFSHGEMVMKNR